MQAVYDRKAEGYPEHETDRRTDKDGDTMKILDSYGHPNNICNTPELATIELHYNKYGTGEYFSTFITHADLPLDGFWQNGLLTKEEVRKIIAIILKSKRRLEDALERERENEQD